MVIKSWNVTNTGLDKKACFGEITFSITTTQWMRELKEETFTAGLMTRRSAPKEGTREHLVVIPGVQTLVMRKMAPFLMKE
jgi:hypothetical protein